MPKFRNITGEPVDLYRPAELGGQRVDKDGVVEVQGEVEEIDDAYLVGEGGNRRAWPMATWELVKDTSAKTAKADKEN